MNRLTVRLWASLIAALCVLSGVAGSRAAEPYDVYAILPLTGGNAFAGNEEREGLRVLEAAVNRGGGIKGRSIRFVVFDSQSSPQVAVELTSQIAAKHVPLLIGDASTGTCAAMAPLLAIGGPVQFCLSPGFSPVRGGYSYTIGPSPDLQAEAVVRYFRERGWQRVAILVATDATGASVSAAYTAAVNRPENHALSIVALERFNPADISIAAQIARIRAAGAQVIVGFVSGSPFGTILRSMRDAGLDLPIVTSQGNLSYVELKSFGDAVPSDLMFCMGPLPAAGEPVPAGPLKAAQLAYLGAFRSQGIKPDFGHAVIWDTGVVVTAALRAAGLDAPPDRIRAYVNGLHGFPAIQGMLDFRTGDMRGVSDLRMLRWDRNRNTWSVAPDPRARG